MVALDENNKKNWKEFRHNTSSKTTIKGGNRKRTILVDDELWKDFSICVIEQKGRCQRNSEVIVELIKKYVAKYMLKI